MTDDTDQIACFFEKEQGEGVTADGSQTLWHEKKRDREMGMRWSYRQSTERP